MRDVREQRSLVRILDHAGFTLCRFTIVFSGSCRSIGFTPAPAFLRGIVFEQHFLTVVGIGMLEFFPPVGQLLIDLAAFATQQQKIKTGTETWVFQQAVRTTD